jgi:peptidoglycan/LPS O-acetylase OafA/YrhL
MDRGLTNLPEREETRPTEFTAATTNSGGRLRSLDSLRGVAAFLVVTFHCWKLGLYAPTSGWQAHIWAWTPLNLAVSGRPAVILFFVLSGFVLACSLDRFGAVHTANFLIRRFCRVYLPFVASVMLSVIAYDLIRPEPIDALSTWFNHLAWTEPPTVGLVATHLLMLGTTGSDSLNPVMWSLVFELRISLIFPLLFAVTYRRPAIALTVAMLGYLAGALMVGCRSSTCMPFRGEDLPKSLVLTGYIVVFFVAGIVLARYRAEFRARLRALPPALVAAIGLVGVYCLIVPNIGRLERYVPADLSFGFGAALLIALAVGSSGWDRVLNSPVLLYLGRISYSLYLTHNIVLLVVAHALYGAVDDTVLVALIIAASLATAEVNYRLIEYPSLTLGQWLTRSRPRLALAPAPILQRRDRGRAAG